MYVLSINILIMNVMDKGFINYWRSSFFGREIDDFDFAFGFELFVVLFVDDGDYVDDIGGLFEVFEQERRRVVDHAFADVLFQRQNDCFLVGNSRQIYQKVFVSGLALEQQLPELFLDFRVFF